MAGDQQAVIVLDSDSDAEEISSPPEAAGGLSFRGRNSSDIISIRTTEGAPSTTSLRLNTGASVGNHSLDVISVSSLEESIPSNREICICCGSLEVHTQHPLFHGGMCAPCTEKFLERFFLCDRDGAQADCAICCWGESLVMCDEPTCHRCFCKECLDMLIGPGTAKEVEETNPWVCFMCASLDTHGLLKRKTRWRAELKHFYDRESNHLWIYQPLCPSERKSIHVLSLFDDITQELKSFGFLGKSMGNGRLKYLENVTNIGRKHIEELGPFDFIFGSTPPVGYSHPSARFFYEFYRILQYGKPPAMFWMFIDNLVLDEEIRDTASRFLEVNRKT
ncbi:DNA (cytosine-5)-methyltransferase 3-like [Tiliqua scincoides]|uniref:DNA (cytosine-5)-methyltransferase 3-like n=1 Tax=Tiliqua scincoides TaxID=71010 RepID=UPI003461C5FD